MRIILYRLPENTQSVHFLILTNIFAVQFVSEPIKDILKLLEKATNSADRRSLGFSAVEIAYGLSHVATIDGNKKMVRHPHCISVQSSAYNRCPSIETSLYDSAAVVKLGGSFWLSHATSGQTFLGFWKTAHLPLP